MRFLTLSLLAAITATTLFGQQPAVPGTAPDPAIQKLVGRLDLEKYKATVKGLTQFGDRREGTERNRKAVDWIEAQLKSYGCETARLTYTLDKNPPEQPEDAARRTEGRGGRGGRGRGAGRGNEPARTPAGTPE